MSLRSVLKLSCLSLLGAGLFACSSGSTESAEAGGTGATLPEGSLSSGGTGAADSTGQRTGARGSGGSGHRQMRLDRGIERGWGRFSEFDPMATFNLI